MVKEVGKFSHKVTITVYPGRGHDTWEQTYSNDAMFKWLLEQNRKNNVPLPVSLDKNLYQSYSGQYIIDLDTITLAYSGENLYIKSQVGDQIKLISESARVFSFKENPSVGIIFQKDDNKVKGFNILGNGNKFARRID
jgi:hypothetical protein